MAGPRSWRTINLDCGSVGGVTRQISWGAVLDAARAIVESYDTPVTLRQLYYRLVAADLVPNATYSYKRLSEVTAETRRAGTFPDLVDRGRDIHRATTFASAGEARRWIRDRYRRDRTEGQATSVYVAVEKAGMVAQLQTWFGDLGVPSLAVGGYASQSYVDRVVSDVSHRGRPAVLLYAGDHDPSGEDIDRDFVERTGSWDKVHRVALSPAQVEEHDLPPQPGKAADTRASSFTARHGRLVQVELDALPPDTLRDLYRAALNDYWDNGAYQDALELETVDRGGL
jgi:hypothetical protein